jgi:hypothetical protein
MQRRMFKLSVDEVEKIKTIGKYMGGFMWKLVVDECKSVMYGCEFST